MAQGPSRHSASVAEIADTLTRIGLEVEEVFDPATALAPFTRGEGGQSREASERRQACKSARSIPAPSACRSCAARRTRAQASRACSRRSEAMCPASISRSPRPRSGALSRTACFCLSESLSFPTSIPASSSFPPTPRSAAAAAKALGLDDAVIEIAITPNRPDCLGVRGVARDLAAAGLGKLKPDPLKPVKGSLPQSNSDQARFRQRDRERLPGVCRARDQRRQERAKP